MLLERNFRFVKEKTMESILISFLYLALHIAIIIIVALAIVWICGLAGFAIDANVYRVGKIIVMLLCLIAVVLWLFSLQGVDLSPHALWR